MTLASADAQTHAARSSKAMYVCDICGAEFLNRQGLNSHKSVKHGIPGSSPRARRHRQFVRKIQSTAFPASAPTNVEAFWLNAWLQTIESKQAQAEKRAARQLRVAGLVSDDSQDTQRIIDAECRAGLTAAAHTLYRMMVRYELSLRRETDQ